MSNSFTMVIEWFKSLERTEIMLMTSAIMLLGVCINYFWSSINFRLTKKHKDQDREALKKDKEEVKEKSFNADLQVQLKSAIQLEEFCNIETSIIITQFSDPNKKLEEDVSLHLQNMNDLVVFFSEYDEKSCSYPKKVKGHLHNYKMQILDYLMYKKSLGDQTDSSSYKGATILGKANAELKEIRSVVYDFKKVLKAMKFSS